MSQADRPRTVVATNPKTTAETCTYVKSRLSRGLPARRMQYGVGISIVAEKTEPRLMKGKPVNDSQRCSLRVIQSFRGEASHTT